METPTTTVSGTPPAVAPPPVVAPVTGPTAAEFAALKAENEASKATAAEHQRTAEFWHGKATAKPATAKPAAEPAEPEVDLLDLITVGGPKALKAYLKAQGLISGEEVDAKVEARVAQVRSETQLVTDYPDLANQESEFFKATARHYGELKKQGVPEAIAMQLGAQQAELAGIKSGKVKTAAQKTEEQKATLAEERRVRALAGGGDHGSRPAPEEADEEVTPQQRQIAIRMLGGNGVTDEQAVEKYKARALKGTVMRQK
jgi:hypothetical protein